MRILLLMFESRAQARDQGQSLVEFALALPLLLVILLGAVDLSRAFQTYIVVTNSAREGARYAGTHPTDSSGSVARASAEATASHITVLVDGPACFRYSDNSPISCSTASNGDKVTVGVHADFQFASLYLFRLSSINISNSATMAIITGGATAP